MPHGVDEFVLLANMIDTQTSPRIDDLSVGFVGQQMPFRPLTVMIVLQRPEEAHQELFLPFVTHADARARYGLRGSRCTGYIKKIKDKGGLIAFITLHVASTEILSNRKIQTRCVEDFTINKEYYDVSQAAAYTINTAKKNGGRVFAIGTTVTRCLESAYSGTHSFVKASSGWTALYIHPGYQLKVVDCLLTNLHQPKTTHMVLTGQFAGVDLLMKAYTSKDIQSCQFDMFGDCMLIIRTTD